MDKISIQQRFGIMPSNTKNYGAERFIKAAAKHFRKKYEMPKASYDELSLAIQVERKLNYKETS